ncbi:uncharacterized protein ACBR49_012056 [Aulostomus maculatus]
MLREILEKHQMKTAISTESDPSRLMKMFWDSSCNISETKANLDRNLILDINEFCTKYLTKDTVVLSNIKPAYMRQLNKHHILRDGELYSEPPYTSSWLNINEQLDDIDKEFGFPRSLMYHIDHLESDRQTDKVMTASDIPGQRKWEGHNLALTPEPMPEEEQAPAVEDVSTPKKESEPSDPYGSLKIEVLSPEEAKVIFEQLQNAEAGNQKGKAVDVEGGSSGATTPIEQICCITKLTEIFLGSKMHYLSRCQCKKQQSPMTDEEKADERHHKPSTPDSQFHSAVEGDNEVIEILMQPCEKAFQVFDLTNEETDASPSTSCRPQRLQCVSEDESLSSNDNEFPNQISDTKEDCEQARLTTTDVAKPPLQGEGQKRAKVFPKSLRVRRKCETIRKRKQPGSLERMLPFLKRLKKSKPVGGQISQPLNKDIPALLASRMRTAELALFGSASQENSAETPKAPVVLWVNLGPVGRRVGSLRGGRDGKSVRNNKEQSVSSCMRIQDRNAKHLPRLKGKRSFSKGLRLGKEDAVDDRSKAEDGGQSLEV